MEYYPKLFKANSLMLLKVNFLVKIFKEVQVSKMQDAISVETSMFHSSESPVHMQQIPLTFFHDGDRGTIVKVRGNDEVRHHLNNLGFVEGAEIQVFSEQSGNVITELKGSRIALDKSAASKIIACL